MRVNLGRTSVKVLNSKSPNYEDIVRAIGYWMLLSDLTKFFKDANMPTVYYHIAEASKEIDRIWQSYDSQAKRPEPR